MLGLREGLQMRSLSDNEMELQRLMGRYHPPSFTRFPRLVLPGLVLSAHMHRGAIRQAMDMLEQQGGVGVSDLEVGLARGGRSVERQRRRREGEVRRRVASASVCAKTAPSTRCCT